MTFSQFCGGFNRILDQILQCKVMLGILLMPPAAFPFLGFEQKDHQPETEQEGTHGADQVVKDFYQSCVHMILNRKSNQ